MRTEHALAYPLAGEGWIWESEYLAARAAFPGGIFTILDVWGYATSCDHRPHDWVHERFQQRLDWATEQRGVVLKLGLNAVYGKYAQMVGGKPGSFTSLAWAGMITASTRARLLSTLTLPNAASIVAFATDAVLSLADLGIGVPAKTLGGWESKPTMQGALFVANGLVIPYDGSRVRSRGYAQRVVMEARPQLEEAWARDGINAKAIIQRREFVNAKVALTTTDPKLYGEWIDVDVEQRFDPTPARSGTYTVDGLTYSRPMIDGVTRGGDCTERCNLQTPPTKQPSESEVKRAVQRLAAGVRTEPLSAVFEARRIELGL